MNRLVTRLNYVSEGAVPSRIIELYDETGNTDVNLDESDLVVFRLMGLNFKYSNVEFKTTCAPVESGVS